jgi:hypothetical protein
MGTLNLPKYGNFCTVTQHIPVPADTDVAQAAASSPRLSSVQQLGFSLHQPKLRHAHEKHQTMATVIMQHLKMRNFCVLSFAERH